LRAFVALELPSEQVIANIVSIQQELTKCGADIKLVERQNLHFTVKFLGEITSDQAEEAKRRLGSLQLGSVEVMIGGVGAFPGATRPSVIWLGVSERDRPALAELARSAIRALEGIGEDDRRGFQPHLTLARVRSGKNMDALSSFIRLKSEAEIGTVRLNEIKLKSSILTPRGPVYADIGVYRLN